MKQIHSVNNPQIKQWKKLLTKKERDKTGTFLVEGFHLVEEALNSSAVSDVIASEQIDLPSKWNMDGVELTLVTDEIIKMLSDTETPQGVVAICKREIQESFSVEGKSFLLIDAVQDPGNLGTIIRTADAAGISAVIVGDGTVDLYNPKVLRSAQGSHFHLPLLRGNLSDWIGKLSESNIPVFGTALENAVEYKEVTSLGSFGLIVGNEGKGVDPNLLAKTTKNLFIPIYGKSESLNVAVATGILLYYLKA